MFAATHKPWFIFLSEPQAYSCDAHLFTTHLPQYNFHLNGEDSYLPDLPMETLCAKGGQWCYGIETLTLMSLSSPQLLQLSSPYFWTALASISPSTSVSIYPPVAVNRSGLLLCPPYPWSSMMLCHYIQEFLYTSVVMLMSTATIPPGLKSSGISLADMVLSPNHYLTTHITILQAMVPVTASLTLLYHQLTTVTSLSQSSVNMTILLSHPHMTLLSPPSLLCLLFTNLCQCQLPPELPQPDSGSAGMTAASTNMLPH